MCTIFLPDGIFITRFLQALVTQVIYLFSITVVGTGAGLEEIHSVCGMRGKNKYAQRAGTL
jgi:hypothetical protein